MQDWLDTIDDLEVSPLETIEAWPDNFVNILRVSGKIRGGDTPVVTQLALVVTLRNGKIIRGREYASREEALEAAGLSGEERQ